MTKRQWLNRKVVGVGEAMVEFAPVGQNIYRRGFAGDTLNTIRAHGRGGLSGSARWRGKLRKSRTILRRRKSCRFARTTWWAMQGSNLRPLPCEGVLCC
jgi:hypothetical protein